MTTTLIVLSLLTGLIGGAAIGAWWLRERGASLQAMQALRHRNDRLQRATIFTLTKWREQVEYAREFLAVEEEYADRLARDAGVSPRDVRTTVRAIVEARHGSQTQNIPKTPNSIEVQIEKIAEVHRYVNTDEGNLVNLPISDEIRKVA